MKNKEKTKEKKKNLKSKFFKLKQFDFTEKEVREAIEDLERFKDIFQKGLEKE